MLDIRDRKVTPRARVSVAAAMCLAFSAVFATTALAAPSAVSCAAEASDWQLQDIDDIAADFFPHLFDAYPFDTPEAFAADIAQFDKNSDGLMCARVSKGDDLNPKSHWYRMGWVIPLKGDPEPIHYLRVKDNLDK